VDDQRVGSVIRAVRLRRGWRQADLARRAKVSQPTVSRFERGHPGSFTLDALRRISAALDVRLDLTPRWRSGDLDRLLNARHSALHEQVARMFGDELPAWVLRPEVTFAIYADRGVIDILAWHAERRALLVIELKTDIVDVNDLVGSVDRKRRVAAKVAADLGWRAATVSVWVIVAGGRTNRARIAAHRAVLRAAFPDDGRALRRWLRDPAGEIRGLSMWQDMHGQTGMTGLRPVRRVRAARAAAR